MNLGDLVHLPEAGKGNLGIVVDFDHEGDPYVEWIISAHYWTDADGPEYMEDLIIVSEIEDGL